MKKLIVLLLVLALGLGLLAGCDMRNGRVQNSPPVTGTPKPAVTPDVTPPPMVSEKPSVSGTPGPRPDTESPEPSPDASPEPSPGGTMEPRISAAGSDAGTGDGGYSFTNRAAAYRAAAAAYGEPYAALGRRLAELRETYAPETAGSSLRAAALAGWLLDWQAVCAPDLTLVAETARRSAPEPGSGLREYRRGLEEAYASALALCSPRGPALREDCGYSRIAAAWRAGDARTLFAALLAGCGGEEGPERPKGPCAGPRALVQCRHRRAAALRPDERSVRT